MGPPDRVACLATISFTNEEKYAEIDGHNRPIYISGIFRNKPTSRVMVDNGSVVNIIPLRTLLSVELTVDHLKHSSMVIQGFHQSEQRPLEKIAIKSRFGEIEDFDEYMVINVDTSYSVLLGLPYMHKNVAVF